MRLSLVLCRIRNPHGHMFRGKERLVRKVTLEHVTGLKNQFEVEEQNMFYLRHPYLTPEQSHGHALALGRTPEAKYRERILMKERPFRDNVTIESRIAHLRYKESWD